MITQEEAKLYLQITDTDKNTLIQELIDSATKAIQRYLRRTIKETTYTDEVYETDGQERDYYLSDFPVSTSNFSVEYDGDTYDSDDYVLNAASGKVHFYASPPKSYDDLKFTYTAGYSDVPYDIKMACNNLVQLMYRTRGEVGPAKSKKVGDISVTYDSASYKALQDDILESIEGYINFYSKR